MLKQLYQWESLLPVTYISARSSSFSSTVSNCALPCSVIWWSWIDPLKMFSFNRDAVVIVSFHSNINTKTLTKKGEYLIGDTLQFQKFHPFSSWQGLQAPWQVSLLRENRMLSLGLWFPISASWVLKEKLLLLCPLILLIISIWDWVW